jgi:2-polyprenyl-3-methyl-5-hydroxy-6-metoxy-1,4-benzoquinol methylase
MQSKDHWEKVYSTKASDSVSWFQPHADMSMRLIQTNGLGHDATIIDVGGGASMLVDDLLDDGFTNLTVLDLSAAALGESQRRLGARADAVKWIEANITQVKMTSVSTRDKAQFNAMVDGTPNPLTGIVVSTINEQVAAILTRGRLRSAGSNRPRRFMTTCASEGAKRRRCHQFSCRRQAEVSYRSGRRHRG